MLDFYIDDGEAKHTLLKAMWDNRDKLSFTFFREEFKRKCKITLNFSKYSIRAEVPLAPCTREDRLAMFHVYKRKMFGLYKSYLGGALIEYTYGDSLEALVSKYIDEKVTALRKAIDEQEEAARRKVNAEFINYLKENCFTSD